MCGRFTLKTTPTELAAAMQLAETPPDLGARFNIAPSLDVLVVPNRPPRHAEVFRWGLVPFWAEDPSIGNRLANARSESAAEKPAFREALRRRRCLVLADGFYEWKTAGKTKIPFYFQMQDGQPFAMAGLWETWRPRGANAQAHGELRTCCLLTTDANTVVGEIHDRMPVILAPQDWQRWLEPDTVSPEDVQGLLQPAPAAQMRSTQVSRWVNTAAHEGPQCIEADGSGPGWLL